MVTKQIQDILEEISPFEVQLGEAIGKLVSPYVEAMLHASGLTYFQAKTCVYYALAACYEFKTMPLLVFLGRSGTGKSAAMVQLKRILGFADDANIKAITYTDLARAFNGLAIAFVENADDLRPQDRCEDLLQKRTDSTQRHLVVHIPPSQQVAIIDNFGATILHRRGGFNDIATRNRSIVIKTKVQIGSWNLSSIRPIKEIMRLLSIEDDSYMVKAAFGDTLTNRIYDTWQPLITIAGICYDGEYLKDMKIAIDADIRSTVADDEPLDIAAKAYLAACWEGDNFNPNHNILLRDVTVCCNENLGVNKSSHWLKMNLREIGYEFSYYVGYEHIKPNVALTKSLQEELEEPIVVFSVENTP